jgi:hypothetical protein
MRYILSWRTWMKRWSGSRLGRYVLLATVLLAGTADARRRGMADLKDPFPRQNAEVEVGLIGLTRQLRVYFGAPANTGVLVSEVKPGGIIAAMGLHAGDVVIEAVGAAVRDTDQVLDAVAGAMDGAELSLTILRDRVRLHLERRGGARILPLPEPEHEQQAEPEHPPLDFYESGTSSVELEQLRTRVTDLERRLGAVERKVR